MTNTINQFRITYKDYTINGLKNFSTIWYDVNFFGAKKIIEKYSQMMDFEIINRQITTNTNSLKEALKNKFN